MTSQPSFREERDFAIAAHENQARLTASLKPSYDFIVCGAGASGSVIARRLAENPHAEVLLVEAGGSDEAETVLDPAQWPLNLGSERDWGFQAQPNPHLNGRALSMSMGKGLGGGSSVNVMVWARGHRSDWDFFASEAGDPAWGYDNVLGIYRSIENWQGVPDPRFRGTSGPVWVQPAANPNPIAHAVLDAARELGIPTFDHPNGEMMEGPGGAAITDTLVRDGRRHSLYRAYVRPWLDRPNLTVLTDTLVRRVVLDGRRAVGVEVMRGDQVLTIGARLEVVLSLGAMHTPKVLMHSGIGDREELARVGIPWRSTCPAWDVISRTMCRSAASGITPSPSHPATAAVRRRSTGRAVPIWMRRTCCSARSSSRYPATERYSAACPCTDGRCLPASRSRPAVGGCAWRVPIHWPRSRSTQT